mgnify:FL=1
MTYRDRRWVMPVGVTTAMREHRGATCREAEDKLLECAEKYGALAKTLHQAKRERDDAQEQYRLEQEARKNTQMDFLKVRQERNEAQAEVERLRAGLVGVTTALVWASGSPDFGQGGQAEVGWQTVAAPELTRAHALLAVQKGR